MCTWSQKTSVSGLAKNTLCDFEYYLNFGALMSNCEWACLASQEGWGEIPQAVLNLRREGTFQVTGLLIMLACHSFPSQTKTPLVSWAGELSPLYPLTSKVAGKLISFQRDNPSRGVWLDMNQSAEELVLKGLQLRTLVVVGCL